MKITEALCNVITEAGGTPTTADTDSVTHALGTLYTTLGGTDTLPDDVADRINSLSDHIGGTVELQTGSVQIKNETSVGMSFNQFRIKEVDGNVYATSDALALLAGNQKVITTTKLGSSAGTQSDTPYVSSWCALLMVAKGIDPTKLTASTTLGTVAVYRADSFDTSKNLAFVLCIRATGSTITEQPLITLSLSA